MHIPFILILLIMSFTYKKNDSYSRDQRNSNSFCKSIIIDIDGDETEYECDSKGELQKLYGISTNDLLIKRVWNVNLDEFNIEFKPGYYIKRNHMDISGNGFKSTRTMLKDKIIYDDILGYEANTAVTHTRIDYDYANDGKNATKIDWYTKVDGTTLQEGKSLISYTSFKSPFAANTFQAFIQEGWSGAASTNEQLADMELFEITSVGNEEFVSSTKGNITYNYTFSDSNQLSSISIKETSIQQIKYKDGRTTSIPNEKTKTVKFIYNCN